MNKAKSALPAIMVIEDDPFMLGILSECLSEKFETVVFYNCIDALAHLQQGHLPGLIISDLNIPDMNGFQFLEQIQASGYFRSIPVIILSGTEGADTRIRCLEAGADDFLVKPFNPRELIARVQTILKRAGKLAY